MHNEIFKIGPFIIHGYGLMIGIGILFAFYMGEYRAEKKGLNRIFVFDLGMVSLIGGFIGTRVLYYITEIKNIIADPSILFDFSVGFVVYGGIIGGVLTGFLYCKIKKMKAINYFDLVMPSVALAQGFGRIGCFLAGCCYGRETSSIIGITFKNSDIAPNGIKLFPTQLFSSGGDFLICLILIIYAKKKREDGKVAGLYLLLYSGKSYFHY